jgi:ParB-like chromosome segregation protein Spo0J
MEKKQIAIEKLNPAEYNPRIMYPEEMEQLKESINKFGLVEPIIVNKDMTVIGGHQRLKAVTEMGWEVADCVVLDLSKKEEKILNLALNKISGVWDETKLADLIYELQNEAMGFSEEEVNQYTTRKEIMQDNSDGGYDLDDDDELKKIFERNEKVQVNVAEPDAMHRKDNIAFYVETFEEYDLIRTAFKTSRQGELDKDKLVGMLKI